ncbi:MAG TPA: hypothetical protein VJ939_06520, partial [Bacteroidales bacterium]|nr:hypothetical protein [Bacteroidales bacterium]
MPELNVETINQTTAMLFSGRLDVPGVARLWDTAVKTVKKAGQGKIRIHLESVDYMDMAGATFISHLSRLAGSAPVEQSDVVTGVKKEFVPLL